MKRSLEIMDTTLRDGEQTSGVSYSPKEKLTIAKLLLDELKIDRIEVASARVSEGELNSVKQITSWAKKNKKIENVSEGRYHQYRNDDSLTAKQKIGLSMREVRDKLTELSKLIDMNVKLKNELNVDSRTYWKNTHKALSKISERLVRLANKVGQLH